MLGNRTHPKNATKVAGAVDEQPPAQPASCSRRGGAAEQMPLPGGTLSSPVRGDRWGASAVATDVVRVSGRAARLGETHGNVEHQASVKGGRTAPPEDPLRLLVGLERSHDPVEDLMRAAGR